MHVDAEMMRFSKCLFLDKCVREETWLDVASWDDANDWPWGNVLLRQGGGSKKGPREKDRFLRKHQWQRDRKKKGKTTL